MRALAAVLLGALLPVASFAQAILEEIRVTPEKAGGVYYAYPGPAKELSAAPEGYTPFYISHYGRHGSRYLIADEDYIRVMRHFQVADSLGVLAPAGKEALAMIEQVWLEADGRGGELTPLGARQHKGIAQRMYAAYPQVFEGDPQLTARSTQVMRCAHSMMAFCEGLKEMNPSLTIPKESAKRWMSHLCWWTPMAARWNGDGGPWKPVYDAFEAENVRPQPLVDKLFTSYPDSLPLSPAELMWGLYWLAVDVQNGETDVDLLSLFTPEQLYGLWRTNNLSFYMHNSSYPLSRGLITANARNLLDNFILTADEYIADGRNGATLRFGHDGNITPLAALMQLHGDEGQGFCGEEMNPELVEDAWVNFRVTPMASNLQMVFFAPANAVGKGKGKLNADDILVKIMMNEHDVTLPVEAATPVEANFYRWSDARRFLKAQADKATAILANYR